MKIAIDVREAFGESTGKGHYAFSLMRSLLETDLTNTYLLLARDGAKEALEKEQIQLPPRVEVVEISKKGLMWHWVALRTLKQRKADIFLALTSFIIPAFSLFPSVVVVHDIVALLKKTKHDAKATLVERVTLKRALRHACQIVAISENTKRDIEKKFPFAQKKINVIYPGEVTTTHKAATLEQYGALARKRNIPEKFILYVGTIEPRKNIAGMIEAYAKYRKMAKHPLPFVLVGKRGWISEQVYERVKELGIEESVHFIGYLESRYLPEIYRHAACFFFPSLYEGFGLIILEAFRYRVPVITANNSSLPEVAGEAALFVEPTDHEAMARTLTHLTQDRTLQEKLREKGLRQLANFDWKKTARQFIKVLDYAYSHLVQK